MYSMYGLQYVLVHRFIGRSVDRYSYTVYTYTVEYHFTVRVFQCIMFQCSSTTYSTVILALYAVQYTLTSVVGTILVYCY